MFSKFLKNSEYIRKALWKYRRFVFWGLLSLVVVDTLEAIAPLLVKRAVDLVVLKGFQKELFQLVVAYLGITLIQGLGRYGWRMYLIRSSLFSGRDLRASFAAKLVQLPASFFDRKRTGDLMSLAVSDTEAVRMAIGAGVLTFADALVYLMTIPIAMFWLSPKLALVSMSPLLLVPAVVIYSERRIHERFLKSQESLSDLSAMAQENINGIKVVKSFSREDAQIRRFEKMGRDFVRLNLDLNRVQSAFGPALDFITSLGLVGVLLYGGKEVMGGSLTIGTLIAFQRYFQKMTWPMTALGMSFTYYERAAASSERLREIFSEQTDVPEPSQPKLPENLDPGLVPSGWKTAGQIEIKDLAFRYQSDQNWVLNHLNLKIEAGERVGVLGALGSGKTTLLSLIPRVYPVDRGMICIDGVDINEWPLLELRSQIGYVGQEVFLFRQSVFANISVGLQSGLAQKDSFRNQRSQAIQLASIENEVTEDSGVDLSGGQKQRLTIARALIRQPSILVLDDALAAVDVSTESKILNNLKNRPGRNTEIVAAHRVSIMQSMDRIIIMSAGKIIQEGKHAQLMKEKEGMYRKYYDQQNLENELKWYAQGLAKEAHS